MTIYKHEGRTVWFFSFRCTDDASYNAGYPDNAGSFIGTQKDFDDFCLAEQDGQGFGCWNVKKRHVTKSEYDEYVYWLR